MSVFKKSVLALFLVVICQITYAQAQVFVRARPERPHYVRVVAPGPRHIWIDEEWESRGGAYVFVGGHWALPPRPRAIWIAGHWRNGRRGWVWIPGHWR